MTETMGFPSASPHLPRMDPDESYTGSERSQEVAEDEWRTLAGILRELGPTLLPTEDLENLAAAEAAVASKHDERDEVINKLNVELNELKRKQRAAADAAKRPSTHPSAHEHDAQVRVLEQQQYTAGKSLNEEQANVAKKEAELIRVRNEREEVINTSVGDDETIDSRVVRLKLLNDLGFSFIPPTTKGSVPKVIARNDLKADVNTFTLDGKHSRIAYANTMWNFCE